MTSSPALSQRLNRIEPSATVAITQKARSMKTQGIDVLSFSVGEPDFLPPKHVIDAVKSQVEKDECHHYAAVGGIPALKKAIQKDSEHRRGVKHELDEILVSVGAKHTLFNLAMALFDEGDEIIIPAPHWVSYPAHVKLFGAVPTVIETTQESGFRINGPMLEETITSKTKALLLCSPSNPTGAAYSKEKLEELTEVIRKHNIWVITDEIYGRLVYEGFEQKSILELAPDLKDQIIIVDGVSKTFAMTGWRIGWMLAPAHVVKACDKLQGQSTTNPTVAAQYAAVAALEGDQAPIEQMRVAFEKRRAIVVKGLSAIEGIDCRVPEGAFYAFPSVHGLIGKKANGKTLENDLDVASYFLETAHCAVVPGTAFGAPGFIRMSYAASNEQLEEGLRRIGEAVSKLTS